MGVSIPRSEFWSFGRNCLSCSRGESHRFQFLGRNSGRSDPISTWNILRTLRLFQFLGRNSGRSDLSLYPAYLCQRYRFNSSVGILVVRTQQWRHLPHICRSVSIPRSEFWSFGHNQGSRTVQSRAAFQFLGRNSGRSDEP